MKNKVILAILIVAFVLRFYKLGEIPPSLDWDETSNAYNAYSLFRTAKDEYGNFLPLTNRSFDDYKPPMYMYLDVPPIALFGTTPFAARLPSALLGFLTVPMIYLLAKKLFDNSNLKIKTEHLTLDIPTIAMLMLAISPWHIQFSRSGFESNIGLFFATSAAVTFFYGLTNKKWAMVCAFLVGLSAYTYHTERIFVPLIFIAALIIYKKQVFQLPKKFLIALVLIATITVIPLALFTPTKEIFKRLEVASNNSTVQNLEKSELLKDQDNHSVLSKIQHNRRVILFQSYFNNYISHFDINFLFLKGDGNFRHHIQDMGLLYLFELPLILFGIYNLVKTNNKNALFILLWLIIAPIAAAPADPAPHANRALPMVIAFEIISAYGVVSLLKNNYLYKKSATLVFGAVACFFVLTYIHNYYKHYPLEKAEFWQFGYKEAVIETIKYEKQYSKIIVDSSIEQAYIFWLFNLQYDPQTYQNNGSSEHFGNYYFNSKASQGQNELFVADPGNFPDSFEQVKTIYLPNGQEAVKIGHAK